MESFWKAAPEPALGKAASASLALPVVPAEASADRHKAAHKAWAAGALSALIMLILLPSSIGALGVGLIYITAALATKEILWDFLLQDGEETAIGRDTLHVALAFCAVYLAGLALSAA